MKYLRDIVPLIVEMNTFNTRPYNKRDIEEYGSPVINKSVSLQKINSSPLHHLPMDHPIFDKVREDKPLGDMHPDDIAYFKSGIEKGNIPPAIISDNKGKWNLDDGKHRTAVAMHMGKTHMPVRIVK